MNRQVIGFLVKDVASYDADMAAWCKEQAALLRAGAFEAADIANIIEEIESLGNEQAHAIESHMIRIVEHLLKLDFSGDSNPRGGWIRTVKEQRRRLHRRFRRNPSLFARRSELFEDVWSYGRDTAADGLDEVEASSLPAQCPYSIDQALNETYFGQREATA